MKKRKRWKCPVCEIGVLGLLRPRKNDVVRYCLPCSAKTGRLVEGYSVADATKAARASERKATRSRASKPRKTKLAFMREDRATVTCNGVTVNYWPVIRKMLASKKWERATKKARGEAAHLVPSAMRRLWDATVETKGRPRWSGVRVSVGRGSGRADAHSVWLRLSPTAHSYNLELILHELTHVAQFAGKVKVPRVNGKRRVHDYYFHVLMLQMAKAFFGYEKVSPYENGWSVGRGYEPDRVLRAWLSVQIKEENPRVMRWLEVGESR